MPVKLGGLGVRSVEGLALPSYIESRMRHSLSSFMGLPCLQRGLPHQQRGPPIPAKGLFCLQGASHISRGASYT